MVIALRGTKSLPARFAPNYEEEKQEDVGMCMLFYGIATF